METRERFRIRKFHSHPQEPGVATGMFFFFPKYVALRVFKYIAMQKHELWEMTGPMTAVGSKQQ